MKRIILFVATNLAIVVVLGIVASLLGVNRFLTSNGLDLGALLGFALIMGFGGAFISLLLSKPIAKWSSGVQVIAQPRNADEAWIVDTVRRFADKAGIGMPEVGIFEGEPNAFATGAFKNNALVAVSTGLLQGMTREEVEAVIGHEVAHIANGDMVTMTLIQGVMNTFVVFLSRLIGYAVDSFLRRGDSQSSGPGMGYWITTIVLDIVLGFFGRHHRGLVLSSARIPRRPWGRRLDGAQATHGQRSSAFGRHGARPIAAGPAGAGHHVGRGQAVLDPPADRGAHRRPPERALIRLRPASHPAAFGRLFVGAKGRPLQSRQEFCP